MENKMKIITKDQSLNSQSSNLDEIKKICEIFDVKLLEYIYNEKGLEEAVEEYLDDHDSISGKDIMYEGQGYYVYWIEGHCFCADELEDVVTWCYETTMVEKPELNLVLLKDEDEE